EFDRHLALAARALDVRGLTADIADQTCKTPAQSRTRFVGHRQLPWIQLERSCCLVSFRSARLGRANPESRTAISQPLDSGSIRQGRSSGMTPSLSQLARSSRSRWITSVASLR